VISKRAIKAFRLDAESLRHLFEPKPGETAWTPHPAVKRLVDRWKARAQQGRDENLRQYRLYAALDHCWESGFRQTTQTLMSMVRDLQDYGPKGQGGVDAVAIAESWGLTHLVSATHDPKTGVTSKTLDFPLLQEVILGLPRAFTMMRVARIMTERLQVPLMKYEPAWTTKINQFRTEVGTQRIEQGNREFGYSATYCEATQGAAKYGQQLMFISEQWYEMKDYVDLQDEQGNITIKGVVGKEGVRYVLPHPGRSCIDSDYAAYTINNDVGPRWANYWRTTKVGSAKAAGYWNKERISRSDRFGDPQWVAYFQATGSCRMATNFDQTRFSQLDRERNLDRGTTYYSAHEDDQPVWETHHFERFNPKNEFTDVKDGCAITDENGKPVDLPDCDVWFRVVLASDDTPLYVTALPSCPVVCWPWEPVGANSVQSSILLELMPYGDHGSNIMTQSLVGLDQNGANFTIFNQDVGLDYAKVEKEIIGSRAKRARKLCILGASFKNLAHRDVDLDSVFKSYRFPQLDVQGHLVMLGQLIGIMKQVAGMSDQEVGGSASHEQSAEEIRTIHTATGHRAEYVAAWLDFAFEAWKRQLWTYYAAYGTLPAFASLGPEFLATIQQLAEQKLVDVVSDPDEDGNTIVSVDFSRCRVEQFVAQRDGPNRIPWVTIGGQMLNFLQVFMAAPVSQAIPPESIIEMVNGALDALQFPRSFRVPVGPQEATGGVSPATQQFVLEKLKELVPQIKAFVDQEVKKGMGSVQPPPPSAPNEVNYNFGQAA